MVNIFTRFPQYCESLEQFWLHEPLNVITNFAFFVGAYVLYKLIKKKGYDMHLGWFLIFFMIILGVGSLAWHAYHTIPTLLADIIPIYIFIIFTFYFLLQSLTQNHKLTIVISTLTLFGYYIIFSFFPILSIFQGSLKYVFALLIFLFVNGLIVKKFGKEFSFILPLSILIGAIVFRIVDLYVCQIVPIGTHFIWHIAVALAVYFSSVSILKLNQRG